MQEAAPHLLPANSSLPSRGSWLPRLGTLSTPTDEPMRLGQAGGGAGLGGGQARLQQTPGTQSPPIGLQQLSPINIDGPELLVKASPLTWGGAGTGPGAARRGPRGWVIGVPEPPGCPALTCTSPGGAQRSPGGDPPVFNPHSPNRSLALILAALSDRPRLPLRGGAGEGGAAAPLPGTACGGRGGVESGGGSGGGLTWQRLGSSS